MGNQRFTKSGLSREGFRGWVTFSDLLAQSVRQVPAETKGVYVVFRTTSNPPRFRSTSIAGHFKRKDPSMSPTDLTANWVPGANVVYIGKADWRKQSRHPLRQRLKEFAQIGAGKPVGHWGGRLIWQLKDSAQLLVAWKQTPNDDPRAVEVGLIEDFRQDYGKPPFANYPHRLGR